MFSSSARTQTAAALGIEASSLFCSITNQSRLDEGLDFRRRRRRRRRRRAHSTRASFTLFSLRHRQLGCHNNITTSTTTRWYGVTPGNVCLRPFRPAAMTSPRARRPSSQRVRRMTGSVERHLSGRPGWRPVISQAILPNKHRIPQLVWFSVVPITRLNAAIYISTERGV